MIVLGQQWEDTRQNQRYPFVGSGAVVSRTGRVLPARTIRDLMLFVTTTDSAVTLHSVFVQATTVAFRFHSAGALVATLTASSNEREALVDATGAEVGFAVLDLTGVQAVLTWAQGEHTFAEVRVLPMLLVLYDRRWRGGLELPGGEVVSGQVLLVAGAGLSFKVTAGVARLSVVGDPFAGREAATRCVRSIGSVAPVGGRVLIRTPNRDGRVGFAVEDSTITFHCYAGDVG